MLAYVTIGTNDKNKAVAFYSELLGELGAKELFSNDRLVFFGHRDGRTHDRCGHTL